MNSKHFTMATPKLKKVLLILVFCFVALLVVIASLPLHGRPNISIKLLGYTNDPTGARLAVIGVTNLSDFTINVGLPHIQITTRDALGDYTTVGTWGLFHAMLASGESAAFTIPSPTNQSSWRIAFNVSNDFGTIQTIKNILRGGRYLPYRITSDWVEVEK